MDFMTPAGSFASWQTGAYLFTEGQIPWGHTNENGDQESLRR